MCGIFGLWDTTHQSVDLKAVKGAVDTICHRGPDDEGYLLYNSVSGDALACGGKDSDPSLNLPGIEYLSGQGFDLAFGFRRLSILDLTPAGHQPMSSSDGRYWIVYNGEVYNHVELREELKREGYQFSSRTDTEVILAAYDQWGKNALNRFVGMFAFAILDRYAHKLFIVRDFFGIKPLYYSFSGGRFSFGSEIKELLQLSEISRAVNPQGLHDYLLYGLTDHSDTTLFQDIKILPPAHYMEIDLTKPFRAEPVRYWDVAIDVTQKISEDEATERFREIFMENIRLHLRSDVPIGAALSGGLDSSSVVMGMRRLMGSQLDLYCFSYIARNSQFDEEKWVDIIGNSSGANVRKTFPDPEELRTDLDHLIFIQDEPFGSTSIYAQHRVFKLAHQNGIKVMEDGQGADELLGGYLTYYSNRIASLVYSGKLGQSAGFVNAIRKRNNLNIDKMFLTLVLSDLLPVYSKKVLKKFAKRKNSWLNEGWFTNRGVKPEPIERVTTKHKLRSALYESLTRTNLPMLLRYEDHNSMAYSIESRVPFLTPDLVQFVFSLPESYLINSDASTKHILRRAMRGIVPDPILDRRDKIGFATPELEWLKQQRPWVEKMLGGDTVRKIGLFNYEEVQNHLSEVLAGKRHFDFRLWRWINLVCWAEQLKTEF